MSRGVRVGLRDVHFAELDKDDVEDGVDYKDEPEKIVGAITANINPNASIETLFADDGPMEVASTLGDIELELEMADLPLETQADLLGHDYDETTGELIRKAGDSPPWVALGFKALKSNGNYRYVWLLKGRFMVPEMGHETRGDTIEFQTATINGSFTRRDHDDKYMMEGDEDEENFDATDWFTKSKIGVTPSTE